MVNEKDQSLKVVAEMPGTQKEDVDTQATEDSLRSRPENAIKKLRDDGSSE